MSEINLYLNSFNGINNLLDNKSVLNNELIEALNIDIDQQGKVNTRNGYKKIIEATDAHDLYCFNNNMYYVDDNNLIKLSNLQNKQIIDINYKNLRTQYLVNQNDLIITNDNFIKIYNTKRNIVKNLTPTQYKNDNLVINTKSGNFPAGYYNICISFVDIDGIEGGTNTPLQFQLTENQAFTITNLYENNDINIKKIRLYISDVNANTLYLYNEYDVNVESIDVYYKSQNQSICKVINKDCINNGSFICRLGGIIYTAKDNILYFSDPFNFLSDNTSNYIEFESNINCLINMIDGLYVSTEDNIYFLSGTNPELFQRVIVYESYIIKYCYCRNITTNEVYALSQMGQLLLENGGKISNLTEKRFTPEYDMTQGASFFRFEDGQTHIINSFNNKDDEKLRTANFDNFDIQIIRNGNII